MIYQSKTKVSISHGDCERLECSAVTLCRFNDFCEEEEEEHHVQRCHVINQIIKSLRNDNSGACWEVYKFLLPDVHDKPLHNKQAF